MQSSPKIVVHLPSDRSKSGSLHVEDGAGRIVGGPWSAFGKSGDDVASNPSRYGIDASPNPSRNPIFKAGDTPTGSYKATAAISTGPAASRPNLRNARSYGPHGAILLNPQSGQALEASKIGQRTGIMIHGGDLNSAGKLRPTGGCVRLSNSDMDQLMTTLFNLTLQGSAPNSCEVLPAPGDNLPVVISSPVEGSSSSEEETAGDDIQDPPSPQTDVNWPSNPISDALPNLPIQADTPPQQTPPVAQPPSMPPPHDRVPPHGRVPPHDRESHDREPPPRHDREAPHDREPPHDRNVHDRHVHDREPPHDRVLG